MDKSDKSDKSDNSDKSEESEESDRHTLISSNNSSILSTMSSDEYFDIRNYMNYDIIKQLLIQNPTELALLEITCIMINNNIKKKYDKSD